MREGFAEAKDDREAIRQHMQRGFAEAKDDRHRLDAKMDSHFRWLMTLMISIVVGILAIIVRVFLIGI
jgi:hypothetical protein